MSESSVHTGLVRALLRRVVQHPRHRGWFVYFDIGDVGNRPPPMLGDARPDIYARDILSGHVLVGEAKTTRDLDNPHTFNQLKTYFAHLLAQRSGELWIGVPLVSAGTALRICNAARARASCQGVPFEVTGWMIGQTIEVRSWNG